jgi:hypothetical protein
MLIAALKPFAGQKVTVASRGDDDGKRFADDFVAVLEAAGWDHNGEAGIGQGMGPRPGRHRDHAQRGRCPRRTASPAGIGALINVVRRLGLTRGNTIYMNGEVPSGQAEVRIGRSCAIERARPPAGGGTTLQCGDDASGHLRPPPAARAPRARRGARTGDLSARPGGRRSRRAACRRCCAASTVRSISARRAMRCAADRGSSRGGRRGGAAVRDGSLDLVVSALALQFVNDLPGTLAQIRRAL